MKNKGEQILSPGLQPTAQPAFAKRSSRTVNVELRCGVTPESPANRDPTGSNRGATLGIAAYLKRWPSRKQEGIDADRMGTGSLVEFVQSPSNRGPISDFVDKTLVCSFHSLPASRLGKNCLGLRPAKSTFRISEGTFACARTVNMSETCVGTAI